MTQMLSRNFNLFLLPLYMMKPLYYVEDILYWCDQGTERIQAIRLSGRPAKFTVRQLPSDTDPFSIAVDGSYIYWTDWNKRGIHRAPKSSTVQADQEKFFSNVLTGANEIKIFRRDMTGKVS